MLLPNQENQALLSCTGILSLSPRHTEILYQFF